MTVTTHHSILSNASTWAQSLWSNAEKNWSDRTGQDKHYRTHVIHPFINRIISERVPNASRNILDLGCGDGVFLSALKNHVLLGNDGTYMGVDINPGLLLHAKHLSMTQKLSYLQMDLTDRALPQAIDAHDTIWDAVISVFVVQEIADITAFFQNLGAILDENACAVLITVHPLFAEWLRDNDRLPVENTLSSDDNTLWRWAGRYPIVDEHQGTFYLPHFHRTIDDYRGYAEHASLYLREAIDIPGTQDELDAFNAEGFSPFHAFPENAYWPAIGEIPSSIAMILTSENPHG